MPRPSLLVLLATVVAVILALGLVGLSEHPRLAFTLGVQPTRVAVALAPGQQTCQGPIDAPAAFDIVKLDVGTYFRPGPPLLVAVTDADSGSVIARGKLPAGYADNTQPKVAIRRVGAGQRFAVCIRDAGHRKVALYGSRAGDVRESVATVNGRLTKADLDVVFLHSHPRSILAMAPTILRRATLFHPAWVGVGLYYVLIGLVALVVPALLVVALRGAARKGRGTDFHAQRGHAHRNGR